MIATAGRVGVQAALIALEQEPAVKTTLLRNHDCDAATSSISAPMATRIYREKENNIKPIIK